MFGKTSTIIDYECFRQCGNRGETQYGYCESCRRMLDKQWLKEREKKAEERTRQERLDALIEQIPKLISLLEGKTV